MDCKTCKTIKLVQPLQELGEKVACLEKQELEKRVAHLEKLVSQMDRCPECRGLPGMLCGICNGTGKLSGGNKF